MSTVIFRLVRPGSGGFRMHGSPRDPKTGKVVPNPQGERTLPNGKTEPAYFHWPAYRDELSFNSDVDKELIAYLRVASRNEKAVGTGNKIPHYREINPDFETQQEAAKVSSFAEMIGKMNKTIGDMDSVDKNEEIIRAVAFTLGVPGARNQNTKPLVLWTKIHKLASSDPEAVVRAMDDAQQSVVDWTFQKYEDAGIISVKAGGKVVFKPDPEQDGNEIGTVTSLKNQIGANNPSKESAKLLKALSDAYKAAISTAKK